MKVRTMFDYVFKFKLLQFLCLFVCLAMKFKEVRPQEIKEEQTMFCYNSSLEGFRLKATIIEVHNVSSKIACMDECVVEQCCRSVNYKHNTLHQQMSECEFLHDLVEDTSSVLERNTSYDHVYFIEPHKVYNSSCFSEKIEHEVYSSCKDAFEKRYRSDGFYVLQLNETSEVYKAYCHMSSLSSQCGDGGWTLVMKLDGSKETFKYDSPLWSNTETFNDEKAAALNGLEEIETKLASYNNTPFTKICLGMKMDNVTNWILLNHTASSLYSVIADGVHRTTDIGPDQWKSLLVDAKLQNNCNSEGFNVKYSSFKLLRIGLVANNEDHCNSCDSLIGFGIKYERKDAHVEAVSGNAYIREFQEAFGYIFVQ